MPDITLASVMQKLDLLDGEGDLQYFEYPLSGRNATGACEVAAIFCQRVPGASQFNIDATVTNDYGERVPVDCDVLTSKLNFLSEIALKLPSFGFMADRRAGRPAEDTDIPSGEELFGFHIVDHMITSLLLGVNTTRQSFSEIFELIPYETYSKSVQDIAGGAFRIVNARQAYKLFLKLGRRYGFDTAVFISESQTR